MFSPTREGTMTAARTRSTPTGLTEPGAVPPRPVFRDLDEGESRALLGRQHIGRLAFLSDGRVELCPVSYVMDGAWLVFRTGPGTKLSALARNPYVAFQVDEVQGPLAWQSVVARGTVYPFSDAATPTQRARRDRGAQLVQRLVPAAFTDSDPTPERQTILGIHVDSMTGRAAEPSSGPGDDPPA
jgi:nitroimidazol reductase NimA-like FMN-containing flavoprotein (pyridoxamine 5'-phosphate oxidase superfamily)